MGQDDNVVYLSTATGQDRRSPQDVYARIRETSISQLTAALRTMLDSVDDALFERAEKGENSDVQAQFFMAMRQVRLRRRELEDGFQTTIRGAFDALRSGDGRMAIRRGNTDELDLSLVDNEALEESIAIDSMIAKARTRAASLLPNVLTGLRNIFPKRPVDDRNNPLDPAQVTQAFVSAAARLNIDINPRLIIYKLFDKHVLGALPKVYEDADGLLIFAGLRTGAKPSAPSAATPPPRRTTAEQAAPLLDILRKLLANEALEAIAGSSAPAGGPVISTGDLVMTLTVMQRDPSADAAAEQGVKQVLGQFISRHYNERRSLGKIEDAAIEIVSMLFEAILNDPELPAAIKALIARLQIPVLKVALLDGSFFSSKQHPARRLINEMAQASLGWIEPAQVERDPLYRQIDRAVERVLTEFDDNVELFGDLLDDFLIFLEEEKERARLVEERTRQAAEGKAKVEGAKIRVDEEIRRAVAGRQVPQVVHRLLNEAWSKVLFLSYLKEGDEGEEWQRQLGVVERLVASVEPKVTPDERRELLTEIPALLHDLREGLNAILFNPFEMTKLFKELESEHIRCLATTEARRQAPSRPAEPAPLMADSAQRPLSPDLAEYVERLDGVEIGTWFEFIPENGNRMRAKLSARVNGGRLIFVNRSGFKIAERGLEELAAELRDGKALLLDDNQLFDKALESVIANLRSIRVEG